MAPKPDEATKACSFRPQVGLKSFFVPKQKAAPPEAEAEAGAQPELEAPGPARDGSTSKKQRL